jgi:hypothetical protein
MAPPPPPPPPATEQPRDAPGGAPTESLVRGAVPLDALTGVISVVKLLCPDTGHLGKFRDHDRVYNVAADVRAPRHCVRLRAHLDRPAASPARPAWARYSLVHGGAPDRRAPPPVERRPVAAVPVGAEAPLLLGALGCGLVHEYVRRGARFRTRAGLVVELYVVEQLATPGDPESVVPSAGRAGGGADQRLAVVEVSTSRAPAEELLAFMSYLAPSGVVMAGGP